MDNFFKCFDTLNQPYNGEKQSLVINDQVHTYFDFELISLLSRFSLLRCLRRGFLLKYEKTIFQSTY